MSQDDKKPGCIETLIDVAAIGVILLFIMLIAMYVDARISRVENRLGLSPCTTNLMPFTGKPTVVCP